MTNHATGLSIDPRLSSRGSDAALIPQRLTAAIRAPADLRLSRPAHDLANLLMHRCPISQPEEVELSERLPHGGMACRRAFAGPDEDVLEKIEATQFVHAENGIGADLPRSASG